MRLVLTWVAKQCSERFDTHRKWLLMFSINRRISVTDSLAQRVIFLFFFLSSMTLISSFLWSEVRAASALNPNQPLHSFPISVQAKPSFDTCPSRRLEPGAPSAQTVRVAVRCRGFARARRRRRRPRGRRFPCLIAREVPSLAQPSESGA